MVDRGEMPKSPELAYVWLATTVSFVFLYFGFAAIATLLTRRVLPALGIGSVIDSRPLREGQLRREIRRSLVSIAIFGCWRPRAARAPLVCDRQWSD